MKTVYAEVEFELDDYWEYFIEELRGDKKLKKEVIEDILFSENFSEFVINSLKEMQVGNFLEFTNTVDKLRMYLNNLDDKYMEKGFY